MDPNEALRQLRLTIKQLSADTNPWIAQAHAEELAEYFDALDNWMSSGGFLPDAWKGNRDGS